jgi:TRAP-type C4-dicarboxylate transport system permease large subunit
MLRVSREGSPTFVGKLFLGGVIPGLLMALTLMALIFGNALKRNYPRGKFSFLNVIKEFIRAFIPLLTPVIIISGFLTGWFTPTEASAIAVLYALIVGVLVYRQITWEKLYNALIKTCYFIS